MILTSGMIASHALDVPKLTLRLTVVTITPILALQRIVKTTVQAYSIVAVTTATLDPYDAMKDTLTCSIITMAIVLDLYNAMKITPTGRVRSKAAALVLRRTVIVTAELLRHAWLS